MKDFLNKATSLEDLSLRKDALNLVIDIVQNSMNGIPPSAGFQPHQNKYIYCLLENSKLLSQLDCLAEHDHTFVSNSLRGLLLGICYAPHIEKLKEEITLIPYRSSPVNPEVVVGKFSAISHYPKATPAQYEKLNLPEKFKLNPEHAYLMFIDRSGIEPSYQRGIKRKYGPSMFDNEHEHDPVPGDKYVDAGYAAYALIENIPIEELSYNDLTGCIRQMTQLDPSQQEYGRDRNGAHGNIELYYGEKLVGAERIQKFRRNAYHIEYKQLMLHQLLNANVSDGQIVIQASRLEKMLGLSSTEIIPALKSRYENKEEAEKYYKKYKELFLKNIKKAKTDEEKMAAILFFTSQIECSHFFLNGNNRLTMQILLNKLLVDSGLGASFAFIPNGLSRFALSLVNKYMEENWMTDIIPPVDHLAKVLEPAIKWVQEGQEFAKQAMRS